MYKTNLTPEEMNRVLPFLYAGKTWDDFDKAISDINKADAARFWYETEKWMRENPLRKGEVYDLVQE